MIIDIIVMILLIYGAIKGFQKGLIIAIFSFLAFIVGLAAAMKFSVLVADYLGRSVKMPQHWLPVISFALVFFVVVLLVKIGAAALHRVIRMAFLGTINRIAGMILFAALYIFLFSVILFYAEQVSLISPSLRANSVTWKYVYPLGPKVIGGLAYIIPVFQDMFSDLQHFFEGVSKDISTSN